MLQVVLATQADLEYAAAGFETVPADGLIVIMDAKGLDSAWRAFKQIAQGCLRV